MTCSYTHFCSFVCSSLMENRVPISDTSAVTHTKDGMSGTFSTSTLVYRPLSVVSAVSQSGCVQPGESACTATYFNPRQELNPPMELVNRIFAGFEGQRETLSRGKPGWPIGYISEKATLDLISHLRLVLIRGLAVLALDYPDWLVYRYPPFNSACFNEWASAARTRVHELTRAHVRARREHLSSRALATSVTRLEGQQSRLSDQVTFSEIFITPLSSFFLFFFSVLVRVVPSPTLDTPRHPSLTHTS